MKNNILIIIFYFCLLFSKSSHSLSIDFSTFPLTEDEKIMQEEFIYQLINQKYDVFYGHAGLVDIENKKSCLNATILYTIDKSSYSGVVTIKGTKNNYKEKKNITFKGQTKNNQISFESKDGKYLYAIELMSNYMIITYGKNLECRVVMEVRKLGKETLNYMLEHRKKGLLPLPLNEFSTIINLKEINTNTGTTLTIKRDQDGPEIIVEEYYVANEDFVAEITGQITDKSPIAILKIDGDRIFLEKTGEFSHRLFVGFEGQKVDVVAIDKFGNRSTKKIRLERQQTLITKKYDPLNPTKNTSLKINSKNVALIIGVEDYEWTHSAAFAKNDATLFRDFALKTLGIPEENIKTLVNKEGNRLNTKRMLKRWLPQVINEGATDFYLYFSGHGLATNDGKDLYLLPYDGDPTLLEDSALTREEIFSTINKYEPSNVIAFLDTCYSGSTRNNNNLLEAARPIVIDVEDKGVPNNFSVFTASANNEIASSLEGAKHGLFSYFVMKGLEGNADLNGDKKITTGELHVYVLKKVTREAMQLDRVQTPQLSGNTNKVLIEW